MITLEEIRRNERESHTAIYSNDSLYQEGSWLKKPIKTVTDLFPHFENHSKLRVLDLGCGVGRNSIAIARQFSSIPCLVDCVDLLELAIEKLETNAKEYGVASNINGIVSAIEDYPISQDQYDWILAVSALEHIDSKTSFCKKLYEIRNGIRKDGIICLVINSNVQEFDKMNGDPLPAQFEVNLPTEQLQAILTETFTGWKILKHTVREQQYDIPRGNRTSDLHTNVVTFAARK